MLGFIFGRDLYVRKSWFFSILIVPSARTASMHTIEYESNDGFFYIFIHPATESVTYTVHFRKFLGPSLSFFNRFSRRSFF